MENESNGHLLNAGRPYVLFAGAAFVWIVVVAWLGWLYHSERVYARDYLERLAALAVLPVYTPGDVVTWKDDQKLLLSGWSGPEAGFRWSDGRKAVFLFRLPPGLDREKAYRLRMHFAHSIETQRVTILFNKIPVADFRLREAGVVDVGIPGKLLRDANVVELLLPGATQPGTGDLRLLAVAMVDFVLEPPGPGGISRQDGITIKRGNFGERRRLS